jgi:hypothetical protein
LIIIGDDGKLKLVVDLVTAAAATAAAAEQE